MYVLICGSVGNLVDKTDLKSVELTPREGSNPSCRTNILGDIMYIDSWLMEPAPPIRKSNADFLMMKRLFKKYLGEMLFYDIFLKRWNGKNYIIDYLISNNYWARTPTITPCVAAGTYKKYYNSYNLDKHHCYIREVLNFLVKKGVLGKRRWKIDRSINEYYLNIDPNFDISRIETYGFKF